jgi:hypothetical protein
MISVQAIKEAIQQLSESDLVELHHWFSKFYEEFLRKQIENSAKKQ